jgi:chaperonin GroEL (HSP60 family)
MQALEIIPYTLAENAGINPISMVTELRNRHNLGDFAGGINVRNGTISDMWAEKIVQPLLVNTSEIQLATECVGMILKIGKSQVFSFLHRTDCCADSCHWRLKVYHCQCMLL